MSIKFKQVTIKITGMVQGVFFRQSIKEEAEKLVLTGWVKNEQDGSVMVIAEGKKEDLQKLVEWCRKGTDGSRVDDVHFEWQKAAEEFSSFEIKY